MALLQAAIRPQRRGLGRGLSWLAALAGAGMALAACAPAAPTSPTAAPAKQGAAPAAKPAEAKPTEAKPAAKPAGPAQKLKINIPAQSATAAQWYIARDKGLFAKNGLDVEISLVSASLGVKAMVAGEFDFTGAVGTTISSAITGVPVRAVMINIDRPMSWLYARPQYKSFADLKGKTIAVSAPGGVDEINTRNIAKDAGLDPERDLVFVSIGTAEQRLQPLIAGALDASVLALPANVLAKRAGMNEIVFYGDKLRGGFAGIGTTQKLMNERRDVLKATIRSILEAIEFYKSNPSEAKEVLQKTLDLDPKLVDGIHESVRLGWTADGTMADDIQRQDIRAQAAQLSADPSTDPRQVYDFTVVREVVAEMKR